MKLIKEPILAATLALSSSCAGPAHEAKQNDGITPTCARVTDNMHKRLSDAVGHSMGTRTPVCDSLCDEDSRTGFTIKDFRGDLLRITAACPNATQESMHDQFCAVLDTCACAEKMCR